MIETDVPTDEWQFTVIDIGADDYCFCWIADEKLIPCDRFGWIRVEDALPVIQDGSSLSVDIANPLITEGLIQSLLLDAEDSILEFPLAYWRPRRGPMV